MKKNIIKTVLTFLIIVLVFNTLYHTTKAMPEGTSFKGNEYYVSDSQIDFMYDLTYTSENGTKVYQQEIFAKVFEIIDNAQEFILIDMFLFNNDYAGKEKLIPLTTEIKDKLIEKKKSNPEIDIIFITDEINNFYGSYEAKHITEMKLVGINVIITDLTKLRDSNSIYSGFWRTFFKPFGTEGDGKLTHPLGNTENNVTLRAWLKLLNTKANHRKVIVADSGDELVSMVTSANPHDGSSLHSNVAIYVKGSIGNDFIQSEKSIAKMSNSEINIDQYSINKNETQYKEIKLQLLTEGKIKESLIETISQTKEGDNIQIAMFYMSDREIIKELLEASKRNVEIEIILDPNKDAFAREKNGIPNRQVAKELVEKSNNKIKIRWYDTKGEQFHTKLIIIKIDGKIIVYTGSANLTRRNIGDLNAEADLRVESNIEAEFSKEVTNYFSNIWENKLANYTLDFEAYQDKSKIKQAIYIFQEGTGLSSF